MIKWVLFQSTWMVGNNAETASYIIAVPRYLLIVLCFYTLSYVTALPYPNSRLWIITILVAVAFFVAYCLMMYAVCGYVFRKYPDMPRYFNNLYHNMSDMGPWTFLKIPLTFYFHFEQLGLALLPALTTKAFRLSLQTRFKSLKLEKSNLELELNFLRSQINPHFLFNTLNSLYALIEEKDAVAASIIASLSNMMRYALYDSNAPQVEAARELDFIKGYIEIQNVRHSNRLKVDMDFSTDAYSQKVPPLILVTFLENAVKHGLDKMIQKSYIKIKAYLEEGKFCFFILNSKPPKMQPPSQGGIGIMNTRRRLNILYPNRHSLSIEESANEYSVLLKIW